MWVTTAEIVYTLKMYLYVIAARSIPQNSYKKMSESYSLLDYFSPRLIHRSSAVTLRPPSVAGVRLSVFAVLFTFREIL